MYEKLRMHQVPKASSSLLPKVLPDTLKVHTQHAAHALRLLLNQLLQSSASLAVCRWLSSSCCQHLAPWLVLLPVLPLAALAAVASYTAARTDAAAPGHQAQLCVFGCVLQLGLLHRQGTAMQHRARPVRRSCCSKAANLSSLLLLLVAGASLLPLLLLLLLLLSVEDCPAEQLLTA
jgi:hypothetical protein